VAARVLSATARLVADRETRLTQVAAVLGGLDVIPVPVPADCSDGFEAAYWRRPRAFLDPELCSSMSALALIPDADREQGAPRLRADLDSGEWHRRWGTCSRGTSSTSATGSSSPARKQRTARATAYWYGRACSVNSSA
jgi:hypothetical protein